MGNVAGAGIDALGAMGKHLISAPGYGFSSLPKPGQPEPAKTTAAATTSAAQPYDFTQFDAATDRYMTEREKPPSTDETTKPRSRPGANTGAGPATPTGGIDTLKREEDAIQLALEQFPTRPPISRGLSMLRESGGFKEFDAMDTNKDGVLSKAEWVPKYGPAEEFAQDDLRQVMTG